MRKVWLTLNRACNLRCEWCYAKHTGYRQADSMDASVAERLLCVSRDLGAEALAFIGGEPTCYDGLTGIIESAARKGLNPQLITNGLKLGEADYTRRVADSGIAFIDISQKGGSRADFLKSTGVDGYDTVLKAIENVRLLNIPFSVSMVLGAYNIGTYLNAVIDAKNAGAEEFFFSFCHDFSPLTTGHKNPNFSVADNVLNVIRGFENSLEKLRLITDGKFILHQSFPLCAWNKAVIKDLFHRSQIATRCQLFDGSSVIFDTDGGLIPCNLAYDVKLGVLDADYHDANSLRTFLDSDNIKNFYGLLTAAPDDNICRNECENWSICCGGCLSNWLNFSFEEFTRGLSIRRAM